MPGRRILLATFGSLGDLHPYIALALELRRRGHEPVIATTDAYAEHVLALGIAFRPMHPLAAQLGPVEAHIERLFDPVRGPEYMVKQLVMPYVRQAYEDLRIAATGAEVLVTHPLAVAGPLLAERTEIPWVSTVLSPMSLLSAIDPPLFPAAPVLKWVRRLGVGPYRAVFAMLKSVARGWEKPLRELRSELGLPPAPPALFEGQFSPALNLALFPPELALPQPDWPANTVMCGFARYDGPAMDEVTRAGLEAFLSSGDAPIVFTLGSSAYAIAGTFWRAAVDAAQRINRRALLIAGRGGNLPVETENVAVFPYLPYSGIFPRAAAVVHQGGIGTLSQALASGQPQLIVPVAFDQPDNAARAARLGLARTVPFARASSDRMVYELRPLLKNPRYAERARAVGGRIGPDYGAGRAVDLIAAVSR